MCGGIFWLVLNSPKTPQFIHAQSKEIGWMQFVFGGVLGVLGVILRYFKPLK